mmetsp:Transcript_2410/g.4856  ORF Transcript_2410/g.4856 Transcript_2410/m.4856 type:complete len:203 (-) Transcript_2410:524-1132(-)
MMFVMPLIVCMVSVYGWRDAIWHSRLQEDQISMLVHRHVVRRRQCRRRLLRARIKGLVHNGVSVRVRKSRAWHVAPHRGAQIHWVRRIHRSLQTHLLWKCARHIHWSHAGTHILWKSCHLGLHWWQLGEVVPECSADKVNLVAEWRVGQRLRVVLRGLHKLHTLWGWKAWDVVWLWERDSSRVGPHLHRDSRARGANGRVDL